LEVLFMPALDRAGYRMIAPVASGAQQIHAGIIRNLEQADLVLCDLSGLNPNAFFELGIRTSLDRPLVLVKDKMTERIPFDLSGINTYTYNETIASWSVANDIEALAVHISAVETGPDVGNEMWRFFGLTKRATSAEIEGDPTQAKLDLILKEVTRRESTSGMSNFSEAPPSDLERRAFAREVEDFMSRNGFTDYSLSFSKSNYMPRRVLVEPPSSAPSAVEQVITDIGRKYNFEVVFAWLKDVLPRSARNPQS
jgi:hypothetical protein